MNLKLSSYSISRDLLNEILDLVGENMFYTTDDDEYNNDDVCKLMMLLRQEIEKQDSIAEAAVMI